MSLVNLRFKDDTTEFMFICSNVCLLYTSKSSFNTTNRRPNAIIVDKRLIIYILQMAMQNSLTLKLLIETKSQHH